MAIVAIPKGKRRDFKDKIRNTYLYLYQKWKQKYPLSKEYTKKKLNANIRSVYNVIGKDLPIRNSTYIPWSNNNWYEIYYSHWYFAVTLKKYKSGSVCALIQDCHYEAEHHNDSFTPYEPYENKKNSKSVILTESQLISLISECIYEAMQY